MSLAMYFNDHTLYQITFKDVRVPLQKDGFSCGWRTMIHSQYILQGLFIDNPTINKVVSHYLRTHH